ncbi:hypothetical protein JRQ81_012200 [Phrynocephalus forsythii]|uniref:DDE Tnp4 domain-containing protein n=1 Tax=Phrynocephalus forsythii TaxID=171643 RepID=A0A9Q0X7B3_9SAUR|nr:hypothetical protein JRQ81_012200 [Phrynocephalus forsythii]
MTRRTLFEVADKLRPYLMRRDTVMRSAVPVEETIALVFQKGSSTVASIVIELCLAMEHVLLKEEVRLPEFNKMTSSMKIFRFPHCIGSIDGTHIPISPPKLQGAAFFNRKSFHSVLLQAACDGDGHSGVNHDAHVFRSSMLFRKMEEGTLIPGNPMFHYAGVSIPPIILGDGAYPLCKWLMKPFAVPRDERECHYNKIFNHSRYVV